MSLTRVEAMRILDAQIPGGVSPELERQLTTRQAIALAGAYAPALAKTQVVSRKAKRVARKPRVTPEQKAAQRVARAIGNMPEWFLDMVEDAVPGWVSVGKAKTRELNKALARAGVSPSSGWTKKFGREYDIPGVGRVAIATHRGEIRTC